MNDVRPDKDPHIAPFSTAAHVGGQSFQNLPGILIASVRIKPREYESKRLKQRPDRQRSWGLFSLRSSHYPGSKTSSTTSSLRGREREGRKYLRVVR